MVHEKTSGGTCTCHGMTEIELGGGVLPGLARVVCG